MLLHIILKLPYLAFYGLPTNYLQSLIFTIHILIIYSISMLLYDTLLSVKKSFSLTILNAI